MAAHAELAPPLASNDDGTECVRKQSIIEAAYALLDEEGLDGLTIRAMLKRTGLARRAFYERFAGKDDLVLAVFEATLKEAAEFFEQEVAKEPDGLGQIRAIVMGLVLGSAPEEGQGIGIRRVSAIVREHMRLAQTRPAELEHALAPLLGVITDRISAGIRTGQLRDCDPALQATLIYNLIASTVHIDLLMQESGEPVSYRRQRLADEIWEFCRRAIVA
jgi:AcrR family transcriptional regulator